MSDAADRLIEEARTWVGTPWLHQHREKGVGADCAGFLAGAAEGARILPAVRFDRDYRRQENGEKMRELLGSFCGQVDPSEMRRGDIAALCDEWLRDKRTPRHLVLISRIRADGATYVIHASESGVREHRMDAGMRRRIHSVWRIKEQAA